MNMSTIGHGINRCNEVVQGICVPNLKQYTNHLSHFGNRHVSSESKSLANAHHIRPSRIAGGVTDHHSLLRTGDWARSRRSAPGASPDGYRNGCQCRFRSAHSARSGTSVRRFARSRSDRTRWALSIRRCSRRSDPDFRGKTGFLRSQVNPWSFRALSRSSRDGRFGRERFSVALISGGKVYWQRH
jgi:hypothetical protein